MANSRKDKAAGRTEQVRVAIRTCLGEGEHPEAVYESERAVLSELAKLRRFKPADAAFIHAEIAATLAAMASRIGSKRPLKPAGFTGGAPQPEDLLAVFDTVYAKAMRATGGGSGDTA